MTEVGSAEAVVHLEHVSKTYAAGSLEVHALQDISLTIDRGDYVAVVGPSGSGKSTLMNILGCLDVVSAGRYWLNGVDVDQMSERDLAAVRNSHIGFVFQQFNLLPSLTARRNVELPLCYAGVPKAQRRQRAQAALERVGLADRFEHRPTELSGGQQQRVAIARALVTDPSLILADEPTGNLDSHASEDVMILLDELHDAGRTIVLITHDHEVAAGRPPDGVGTGRRGPRSRRGTGMRWHETLRIAFEAVRTHRMRSLLTVLGIWIGIASVTLTVGLGQGASQQVQQQINSLGSNLLVVTPGSTTTSGVRGGRGSATTLTMADAEALQDKTVAPDLAAVAPVQTTSTVLTAGSTTWTTTVTATTPDWMTVRARTLSSGRNHQSR